MWQHPLRPYPYEVLARKNTVCSHIKNTCPQDEATANVAPERAMLTFNLCGHDFSPSVISTQSHLNSRVEKSQVRREKSYILLGTENTTQILGPKVCHALPRRKPTHVGN
jgi:hypothetical protein